MKRRVVVTGLGAVTPLGVDVASTWDRAKRGEVAVGDITLFDTDDFKVKIACEVKNFDPTVGVEAREVRRTDRFVHFAMAAAHEATADSGIDFEKTDNTKVGVYVGSGIGGMRTFEDETIKMHDQGPRRVSPLFVPMMIGNMAAASIAMKYKCKGPCVNIVTACAVGTSNLGEAMLAIERGTIDVAIAGGAEACVSKMAVAGFANLTALSTQTDFLRASIPFDARRDGFVIGEGAGILVLEDEEHAKARGAKIYCYLSGYGSTCDAYHMTAPDPEGDGAKRAMEAAIEHAGIKPSEIDYINAHGTSTPHNDRMESKAIWNTFKDATPNISVSSTKSMIGHLMGAAGAVEAVVTIKAIEEGFVPPTAGYEEKDPECDLDVTPKVGKSRKIRYAISNSFGFGGHNAVVLFEAKDAR